MARRSLLDLWGPISRPFYDWMYRRGAPWGSGPRPELVALVESGAVTPDTVGLRAIDIGCGSGADTVFLAEKGFDAVGFDFSPVAIAKARAAAAASGVTPELIVADIFALSVKGPFDFLFDGGTLDDFPRRRRPEAVAVLDRLSRPGATLALWCFTDEMPTCLGFSSGGRAGGELPGSNPMNWKTSSVGHGRSLWCPQAWGDWPLSFDSPARQTSDPRPQRPGQPGSGPGRAAASRRWSCARGSRRETRNLSVGTETAAGSAGCLAIFPRCADRRRPHRVVRW